MRHILHHTATASWLLMGLAASTVLAGCLDAETVSMDANIPVDYHPLYPEDPYTTSQVAAGVTTGEALKCRCTEPCHEKVGHSRRATERIALTNSCVRRS